MSKRTRGSDHTMTPSDEAWPSSCRAVRGWRRAWPAAVGRTHRSCRAWSGPCPARTPACESGTTWHGSATAFVTWQAAGTPASTTTLEAPSPARALVTALWPGLVAAACTCQHGSFGRIATASSRRKSYVNVAEQGRCRMTLARHASPPPPTRITQARAVEDRHRAVQNARAARTVAGHAADVEECSQLLAMLGLDAASGKLR